MTNQKIDRITVNATVAVDIEEGEAGLWYAIFVRFGPLLASGKTRDETACEDSRRLGRIGRRQYVSSG